MGKSIENIKNKVKKSTNTWIFKCFAIALVLEVVLEILGRRSIISGVKFVIHSPIVYLYNVSIIFFTLLFALFLRKRVFGLTVITLIWLICGIVNFAVLGYRVTPFAAIDVLMVRDVISMIDVYFKPWQLVLIGILAVLVIFGMIVLFIKSPKVEGSRHIRRTMLACVGMWIAVSMFTKFGYKHNIISDDFANLGMAYQDYGFAYCFTNSIIDNGIDKPDRYDRSVMTTLKHNINQVETYGKEKKPNIIYIQLESFFDPRFVKGLEMSENPLPNFTKFREEFPSGYLTVPALGAGTANTEFEMMTGFKSSYFGAGEYPYKTTINHTPVESICSVLKSEGYGTYAIHNNKASFYDRHKVYDQMGYDHFISLEYMYDVEYTSTGWAKDKTLVDDIMKCLKDTDTPDLVYTISVQGHGRYPDGRDTCENHIEVSYEDEEFEDKFYYYVNQIYEMDQMIGELKKELDEYGEDYVLVLYGDHLPTLGITDDELTDGNVFQTEYIVVNNIHLHMEDKDLAAYEFSTRLFRYLKIPYSYAMKVQLKYINDPELMDEKLILLAYDEMFGENYIFRGQSPCGDYEEMVMGVDEVKIESIENTDEGMLVRGCNFNDYSHVYEDGEKLDTTYIDRNTLLVEDYTAESGENFTVRQVDKSKMELGSSGEFVFE